MIWPWELSVGQWLSIALASSVSLLAHFITFLVEDVLTPSYVQKELESNPIFRDFEHPGMVYVMFASPLVNSCLLGCFLMSISDSLPDRVGSRPSMLAVVLVSAGLWLSSAHGIFIDFCTYKLGQATFLNFEIMTFVQAIVNGVVMHQMLKFPTFSAKLVQDSGAKDDTNVE